MLSSRILTFAILLLGLGKGANAHAGVFECVLKALLEPSEPLTEESSVPTFSDQSRNLGSMRLSDVTRSAQEQEDRRYHQRLSEMRKKRGLPPPPAPERRMVALGDSPPSFLDFQNFKVEVRREGLGWALKNALASDGHGDPALETSTAIAQMLKSLEESPPESGTWDKFNLLEQAKRNGIRVSTGRQGNNQADAGKNLQLSRAEIKALCARYFSLDCSKALTILNSKVRPIEYGGVNLGYPELVEDYFSRPKIRAIVLAAAKSALRRIQALEKGEKLAPTHLLEELNTAAKSVGGTEDDVWRILGFYGLRGSELDRSLKMAMPDPARKETFAATQALFASIPYLDALQFKVLGTGYALPPGIRSRSALPKPYHFWLPAFLTRTLIKDYGYSPRGASLATRLAHIGYEFASNTPGRLGPRGVLTSDSLSQYNNGIRHDLVVGAAGTEFGKSQAGQMPWNAGNTPGLTVSLDEVWSQYYDRLRKLSPLSDTQVDKLIKGAPRLGMPVAFYRWLRVIRPDIPYEITSGSETSP